MKIKDRLDSAIGRIISWSAYLFGDRHPLAFLGEMVAPVATKTRMTRTKAELAIRSKRRNDPAYMGSLLEECMQGHHWRRAIRVVEFAGPKAQRKLLETFIENGWIHETQVAASASGIELSGEDERRLSMQAITHVDSRRRPLNGRRPLFRPRTDHSRKVTRLTPLEQTGYRIANELKADPKAIRYN